jgi:hypothetical protein
MAIHFDLELREGFDQFESLHWMAYRLTDGRAHIDLTGIALLALEGNASWVRKTLKVVLRGRKVENLLNLGALPQDHHWEVQPVMWTVSAAPASILDLGTAVNAGWAVDTCDTAWDLGEPSSTANLLGDIPLYMNLAVRDTDAILYRVQFDFRAVGNLREVEDPVIE